MSHLRARRHARPLTHKKKIEAELEGFGIRLNKRPPNISLIRKEKGTVGFRSTCTTTAAVARVCRLERSGTLTAHAHARVQAPSGIWTKTLCRRCAASTAHTRWMWLCASRT